MKIKTISSELLHQMDAYWRAANYLSVGQIYLYDNPLLKQSLTLEHIKPRLLGHWGTTPGLNFIYVHLNRVINEHDLNVIYITGPGHGGPGLDLMKLQPQSEHPHGLPDRDFDGLFPTDKPVIFAYHGYPTLIHRFTYRRTNHGNIHVRGYKEEGTTTTPFDMVVMNDLDRFHLVADVIDRVPQLGPRAAGVKQAMRDKHIEHKQYIAKYGEDMPEIRNWKWSSSK